MWNDDDDIDEERRQNIKELHEFLSGELRNSEVSSALAHLTANVEPIIKKQPTSRKRKADGNFTFTGSVPLERRHSARVRKETPKYNYDDLPDEGRKFGGGSESDLENMEDVVFIKKRRITRKATAEVVTKPVEEITNDYLSKIANSSTNKVYSQNGTSCHQCRQKTMDSKTYCRSGECTGVRGQFCGPCLRNRYGEEVSVVLLDPNWACPPCRGLCNCSICRTRDGKRPTGILAPIAQKNGHDNVKDFLISLQGKGDYVEKAGNSSGDEDKSNNPTSPVKVKNIFKSKPNGSRGVTNKNEITLFKVKPKKPAKALNLKIHKDEYLIGFDECIPVMKIINKDDYTKLLGFDEDHKPVLKHLKL